MTNPHTGHTYHGVKLRLSRATRPSPDREKSHQPCTAPKCRKRPQGGRVEGRKKELGHGERRYCESACATTGGVVQRGERKKGKREREKRRRGPWITSYRA
mgnify:CR=1 FL=1